MIGLSYKVCVWIQKPPRVSRNMPWVPVSTCKFTSIPSIIISVLHVYLILTIFNIFHKLPEDKTSGWSSVVFYLWWIYWWCRSRSLGKGLPRSWSRSVASPKRMTRELRKTYHLSSLNPRNDGNKDIYNLTHVSFIKVKVGIQRYKTQATQCPCVSCLAASDPAATSIQDVSNADKATT